MGPAKSSAQHGQAYGTSGPYVKDLIPPNVGSGPHRKNVQARTLGVWIALVLTALGIFFQNYVDVGPKYRAAALGLVFPGAGYLASANVLGGILFALTWASVPLALFAWFGAGAILFPLLVWGLSILGAYFTTGDTLWENSGYWAPGFLFTAFLYANGSSRTERNRGYKKRTTRNEFILRQAAETDRLVAAASKREEDEELSIESLRKLQFLFDQAFQSLDDWSGFTIVDQYQTAALRYQIYQMMFVLGLYQSIYAPNAHGYVNEAFQRIIERSLTQKVLNFWKWERLTGKFSLDWDPVKKDNIMVTGFLLQGVMLYTANTGDMRYTKPGSLVFNIDEKHSYRYSLHDLQESLVRQWSASPYCLISCEPNWIYVMCNLQGMTGAVLYDRVFGTKSTEVLLPIFEESLNTNFSETSGSVLTIRSELTGFTIPGLCGAAGDLAAIMMGCGPLRNFSRRLWAIIRNETVQFETKTKEVSLTGLVGADKIDAGSYRSNEYAMYTQLAIAAGEYGDEELKEACVNKFERAWGVKTAPTGSHCLDLENASCLMNQAALTAALIRPGAYHRMVQKVARQEQLRLTTDQEDDLERWILRQKKLGHAPTHAQVRTIVRSVLARHGDHAPLGRKWTTRFVERHPALKTKLGRRTDWERVNAATPANIKRLFDVYETVDWIPPERRYNADEGGIMEGQGVNGLVIGSSQESPNAVPVKTATVRTWTSIIECISAVGVVLHPLVISKAKSIQEQWFRRECLEKHLGWQVTFSKNGWTSNSIALEWLEKVFLPQTAPADPADARLLIVDGHGSHATEEFMAKCYLNNVYLLFLPAHCSHVLQPLDLGCFSSLKAAYRTLVGEHTALTDSTRVGKQRFLDFYARAREIGFRKENIRSGWRAAGLWPVNINKPLASRWVMVLTKSALPPSETHDIVTPKRGGDVVKLFSAKSSSPSSRLSIRKAAAALDKVAIELAMKDREIERLRAQLEAAQPKKKRKIRQDPNECFISLAQILAEANREPDQRVIQSQKGDLDCIVVDGKSSSESEEDPAPVRRSTSVRRPTKRYIRQDLSSEESD
ncbi:Linalool dehydratase/isomerase [Fusarium oxysporum f. sp. conglutinans]|nr:Linalool dehydratase/isomerase [Fusarium oxysporum f. sp. conglutinans]